MGVLDRRLSPITMLPKRLYRLITDQLIALIFGGAKLAVRTRDAPVHFRRYCVIRLGKGIVHPVAALPPA